MKANRIFDRLFLLSKTERNGALVLLLIICLLLIVRLSLPLIVTSDENKKFEFSNGLGQLEPEEDSIPYKYVGKGEKNIQANYNSVRRPLVKVEKSDSDNAIAKVLFQFDPNKVSFDELMKLGFPRIAANNLISYRLKGGIFRKPIDIRKIYGVDSVFYAIVLPYVQIAREGELAIELEINGADSSEFTKLKGVGPVFASRICRYRNQLGGFVSVGQIKEVYQFPEETYNDIDRFLTIDLSGLKKININFAGIDELKKHPYCKYENARKIVDYRSRKGYIQRLELLVSDSVIDPITFERLSPYLKTD